MDDTGPALSCAALTNGQLGISAVYGSFLAEAASHCLRCLGHVNPVLLDVTGDVCATRSLEWSNGAELHEWTWADMQEAAEALGH
jgi:hypothetical protein